MLRTALTSFIDIDYPDIASSLTPRAEYMLSVAVVRPSPGRGGLSVQAPGQFTGQTLAARCRLLQEEGQCFFAVARHNKLHDHGQEYDGR